MLQRCPISRGKARKSPEETKLMRTHPMDNVLRSRLQPASTTAEREREMTVMERTCFFPNSCDDFVNLLNPKSVGPPQFYLKLHILTNVFWEIKILSLKLWKALYSMFQKTIQDLFWFTMIIDYNFFIYSDYWIRKVAACPPCFSRPWKSFRSSTASTNLVR